MHWWQTAVIYQIYPRSFQDSNGDGVGDLKGIQSRLPYLADLGIDAIWICPIFPSPMTDFGYDISDYTDIDPLFGTLAEFDVLLQAAHAHGLKLILDFVPNHTSDRHPWFLESRASRQDPKRDWYIWRDPAEHGGPPNNWLSQFGGSAWEYDQKTRQYYCHTFLATQPDLNWRNREVRVAMYEAMRFWLKRGVDGFRVDAVTNLIKDALFRDNPSNPEYSSNRPPYQSLLPIYTADRPEVHDVIREMRGVADEFSDRTLIGEISLPIRRLVSYYGEKRPEFELPFNFALLWTPWQAREIARIIDDYEAALAANDWPNWVLGNHDRTRIASRVGERQARIAAMLLLTLRGTPTIYYGDEIGMEEVALRPDELHDPFGKNVPGFSLGRDGCRTPMQWSRATYGGFSTVEPWLPLEADYERKNVAVLAEQTTSIYQLYRHLLALRRRHRVLQEGSYRPVAAEGQLLLFLRILADDRFLLALNMGAEPRKVSFQSGLLIGTIVLSSFCDREQHSVSGTLELRGDEGIIIELAPHAVIAQ